MKLKENTILERCSKCGRRLKKKNLDGQSSMLKKPERICGNCVRRQKLSREKPLIMEALGQTYLFKERR